MTNLPRSNDEHCKSNSSWRASSSLRCAIALICIVSFGAGCTPTLKTDYGAMRKKSINGCDAFIDLIKDSGRPTDIWIACSPKLEGYSGVVAFVSTDSEIEKETMDQLSKMLWASQIGVLMIIAKNGDAALNYWTQIAERTDLQADDLKEAVDQRDYAKVDRDMKLSNQFNVKTGKWYGMTKVDRSSDPLVRMVTVTGDSSITTVTARWPLARQLVPADDVDILWESSDEALMTVSPDGRVYVLASAVPLLNGGLVDQGNRQLAEDLIHRLPVEGRIAVVTTSNWFRGGDMESPGIIQFLKVPPHGWIFGQTLLALLIFCWWKFPIFGRPRKSVETETSRFGKHVDALGLLLRRTRDANYARQTIRTWQRMEQGRHTSEMEHRVESTSHSETDPVAPRL